MPSLLEPYEFKNLPAAGEINPNRLRFAQPEISKDFANVVHGDVYKLATLIAAAPGLSNTVPPVEIGEFGTYIWSFDSRRLAAFQMARQKNPNVTIRYTKINAAGVKARLDNFGGEGSRGGIVIGVRQGGKHATRLLHCNPDYDGAVLYSSLDFSPAEFSSAVRVIDMLV